MAALRNVLVMGVVFMLCNAEQCNADDRFRIVGDLLLSSHMNVYDGQFSPNGEVLLMNRPREDMVAFWVDPASSTVTMAGVPCREGYWADDGRIATIQTQTEESKIVIPSPSKLSITTQPIRPPSGTIEADSGNILHYEEKFYPDHRNVFYVKNGERTKILDQARKFTFDCVSERFCIVDFYGGVHVIDSKGKEMASLPGFVQSKELSYVLVPGRDLLVVRECILDDEGNAYVGCNLFLCEFSGKRVGSIDTAIHGATGPILVSEFVISDKYLAAVLRDDGSGNSYIRFYRRIDTDE